VIKASSTQKILFAGVGAEGADGVLSRIRLDPVHRLAVPRRSRRPHRQRPLHLGHPDARRHQRRDPGGGAGEGAGNYEIKRKKPKWVKLSANIPISGIVPYKSGFTTGVE
jgi:hypothetical protein